MKIPLLALIFQGIPESIALITLAYIIAKIEIKWKNIIVFGVLITTVSYVIRLLPFTFGIHTILLICILFFILTVFGKGNLNTSLLASLLSALALILTETICLSILMPVFGVTSELFFNNTLVRILITLPQVFLIFALAYAIYRFRLKRNSR